jgi:hypothetical protein
MQSLAGPWSIKLYIVSAELASGLTKLWLSKLHMVSAQSVPNFAEPWLIRLLKIDTELHPIWFGPWSIKLLLYYTDDHTGTCAAPSVAALPTHHPAPTYPICERFQRSQIGSCAPTPLQRRLLCPHKGADNDDPGRDHYRPR